MRAAILPAAGLLAACTAEEPTIDFQTRAEEVCYQQVAPTLPSTKRLVRDSGGNVVEATIINSQLRDVSLNPRFNRCLVEESGPPGLTDMGTVRLTQEELAIWDTLSDPEKRRALEFMRDGGMLTEFVAG